jgi:hypothetical protein
MSLDNSYQELKLITDGVYSGKISKGWSKPVIRLLKEYGVRMRNKDGKLIQTNISIPKSIPKSILVGIRYQKKDKTHTEDHFLFEKGQKIQCFYKGSIKEILPEYKGAHKLQIDAHI